MNHCFRDDGHLQQDALRALAVGKISDPLQRLEMAEHLSWCDVCLQRYTELLTQDTLTAPEHSCEKAVRTRIRQQSLRLFTGRYATAAAAVVLALTLLWSERPPASPPHASDFPAVSATQRIQILWDHSVTQVMDNIRTLMDGPNVSESHQGGLDS